MKTTDDAVIERTLALIEKSRWMFLREMERRRAEIEEGRAPSIAWARVRRELYERASS